MPSKTIILAGSYEEAAAFSQKMKISKHYSGEEFIYFSSPSQMNDSSSGYDGYFITGTFWQKEDAAVMFALVKSNIAMTAEKKYSKKIY